MNTSAETRLTVDYERIAMAIEWIAAHRKQQPTIAQMATASAMSEAHFSRLFRRWAGISPQRYLASLTLNDARLRLRENATVEEAAWSTGLSGSGRLHDLFVRIDSVSPGEFKRWGDGLALRYTFADSPFGEVMLVMSERGIVSLTLADAGQQKDRLQAFEAAWPRAMLHADKGLADFAADLFQPRSERDDMQIAVVLSGSPFQHKVWQALLDVSPGETISYGTVAERIGHPGASRAVGSAVGQNAVAMLIPCHRVLRADGEIGGYRWGVSRKRVALAWEQCQRLRG